MPLLGLLENLKLGQIASLKKLLEQRSVTDAAEDVGVTQSCMSRNLAKFRDIFKDPLLVRSGKDFILTPRAQDLKKKIDVLFDHLATMADLEFIPEQHPQEFIIACPDYVGEYVLGEAMSKLYSSNNLLQFQIINWDQSAKEMLIKGHVHLAVSIEQHFPPYIYHRLLDEDELVWVTSCHHPAVLEGGLTDKHLNKYGHVLVCTGGGWLDFLMRALRGAPSTWKIKLRASSYNVAFSAVRHTDMVAVVPLHVVANSRARKWLHVHPMPYECPKISFSLWWHERHHHDRAHIWMRKTLFPQMLSHPNQLAPKRGISSLGREALDEIQA